MGWTRTDDLGGAGGAFPTTFGLAGQAYVLDLNEENSEQLFTVLQPYIQAAKPYAELPPAPYDADESTLETALESAPSKSVARRKAVQSKVDAAAPPHLTLPEKAARRRASRSAAQVAERDRVRQWAQAEGLQVAERGRISAEIMQAYKQAHE